MKQLINKYLGGVDWLITGLFFIIIPVIYSNQLLDPVLYSRYLALSIWILTITIVISVKVYKGQFSFYFTRIDKFIFGAGVLFLLVNVISSFGAINRAEAIYKTFKEITLFVSFFYLYQMLRNTAWGKDTIIKAVLIMASIFLGIAVVQLSKADFSQFIAANSNYGYYLRQAIFNVKSTLANWNPFAYYLLLSLPFSIYGSLFYKKIWRGFSILVGVLSLGFIGLLSSKGGWAGTAIFMAVGMFLLYLYLFFKYPKETGKKLPAWMKSLLIAAPIVIILSGVVVIKKSEIKIVKVLSEKVGQIFNAEKALSYMYSIDNPSSAQTRTLVWANTLEMVRNNPFIGVGPGQWRIEYAKYGLDGFEYDIRNGVKHFQRTHNDFLWILGETGFLGLLLYLFVYIGVLVIAFKNAYREKDLKVKVLNLMIFSVLVAFVMVLFVSFARERISHNLMYLLLMALALYSVSNKEEASIKIYTKKSGLLAGLLVVLALGGFNLTLANDMVKGEKAARVITYAVKKKNNPVILRAARSIEDTYYTMDAFAVPISYYKGVALSSMKKIEEAKIELQKAYEIHPYHLPTLNNLGTSYDLTGNRDNALAYYNKALAISPRYKESLVNIAIVYYNLNDLEKALNYISKIKDNKNNPAKYEETLVTICRKRASQLVNEVDIKKLQIWFKDENKVKATFVRFQEENESFDKILLQEIGK